MLFLGLDLETTGLEPERHAICQLGLAFGPLAVFRRDLRPWEGAEVQQEALRVNGFTPERLEKGQNPIDAERDAVFWLREEVDRRVSGGKGQTPESGNARVVAVGWNVGTFDLVFVKRYLPSLARKLHYHTIDLNAICYALGNHGKAKRRLKDETYDLLGVTNEHDAGFDAVAAVMMYKLLCDWVQAGRTF